MKSIRQLPKSVHSTLRSSVILFDLTRVVEELIFNSIDAGSTKVNVTIRVDSCYVKVDDDGYGITRDGLVLLGERHATSKPHCFAKMEAAPEYFGFRGEALASLSDVSLLEITTKARGTPNGYRKIIKGCKCLYLGLDDNRQDLGTTVIVRDLFYNQPVRRKYMLSSPKKVLHSVKKCVLRIALVHPLVSFKVIDNESGAEVLCTRPSPSPMPLVTSAFGIDVTRSLHELSFSKGSLMLSGYLSGPVGILSMKAFQYVYINSRFVSKGPIHKLLNNLASSSKCLDSWKDSSGFQNGRRNRIQTSPAYLLNLRCPQGIYDLTFEPSKTIVEFKKLLPMMHSHEANAVQHIIEELQCSSLITLLQDFLRTCERTLGRKSKPDAEAIGTKKCRLRISVVCQDWDPLLSFIEQSIRSIWRHSPMEGESHGREDEVPGQHETWKEDGNGVPPIDDLLSKDISVESKFTKKKSRIQYDLDFMHLSPSSCSQEIASEESQLLSHGKNHRRRSQKTSVNPKVVKAQKRSSYLHDEHDSAQDMTPSPCATSFKCVSTASSEGDLHLWSPWNRPFLMEDNFSQPSESNSNADCFSERRGNLFSEADANLDEGSSWIPPSCGISDHGNEVLYSGHHACLKKPFLRNCSLLGSLSPVGALFDTSQQGTDAQMDEFWNHGKRSVDMIKPLDAENCIQDIDFSLESSFHDNISNFIPFSSIPKQCHKKRERNGGVLLSKDDKPHSYDRVSFTEENDLDLSVQVDEIVSDPLFTYSELCSMSPFSTAQGKVAHSKAEYAPEGNFLSHTTDDPCYIKNRNGADELLGNENMWDSSTIEECSLSSSTNIEFDYEYFATPKKSIHTAPRQLNNIFMQKVGSLNKVAGGTDWSFLNSSLANSINDNDRQALQIPQSCNKYANPREELDSQNGVQNNISRRRSRRSHSAPPFYRGKRKFSTINNCLSTIVETKSNVPQLLVTSNFKHSAQTFGLSQHYAEPGAGNDLKISDLKNSSQAFSLSQHYLEPSAGNDSLFHSRTSMEKIPHSEEKLNRSQNNENVEKYQDSDKFQLYNSNPVEDQLEDSEFLGVKWRNGNLQKADGDQSNNFHEQNDILNISSGLLQLAGASVIPDSITKDCLQDAKVFLQLDKKFIPVVGGGILAVIDQHAADERIRLEELREKVLSGEGKTVAYLETEQELVLPEFEYQLLQNYAEQIKNWGWVCNIHAQQPGAFTKNINLLHRQSSVVTLLAVPCIVGVNLTEKDLLEFLEQLAETDGSSTMPPSVLRVLNFKACRGAIMFGDALLPSECSLIIEELKQTSLCFQCAHGRPTTVPLVNLEALHKQIANLGSWNPGSDETWHGLRRHTLTFERARQRLISAGS